MKEKTQSPLLVADIGGTNANFGIIQSVGERYELLEYYQLPSQEIVDFTKTVNDLLQKIAGEKHIRFNVMVIGVAGVMCGEQNSIKATNLPFTIDKADLKSITGISEIYFLNDFVCVALGYDFVNDTLSINDCAVKKFAQKAFIGAGTGLGQSFAVYSKSLKSYIPLASEGGHVAFEQRDSFDGQFASFIQERQLFTHPVSFENILSGRGIAHLYEFLGTINSYKETDISREIALGRFQPDYISRYSEHDERCTQTFRRYVAYYARYAQHVALQSVACGGLYIAGGIAAKNKNLFFRSDFLNAFTDHARHQRFLQKIPIFLIQDYQVSLYGGAHYYNLIIRGIL